MTRTILMFCLRHFGWCLSLHQMKCTLGTRMLNKPWRKFQVNGMAMWSFSDCRSFTDIQAFKKSNSWKLTSCKTTHAMLTRQEILGVMVKQENSPRTVFCKSKFSVFIQFDHSIQNCTVPDCGQSTFSWVSVAKTKMFF